MSFYGNFDAMSDTETKPDNFEQQSTAGCSSEIDLEGGTALPIAAQNVPQERRRRTRPAKVLTEEEKKEDGKKRRLQKKQDLVMLSKALEDQLRLNRRLKDVEEEAERTKEELKTEIKRKLGLM